MKQHTTANLHVRVEKILESLRPFLRRDNGDVELVEITTTHIVRVELKGSCVSCPMSAMTLKNGIGEAIKSAIPEIQDVQATNLPAQEST